MHTTDSLYTRTFYHAGRRGSRISARTILPIAFDFVAPHSVVDIGCGIGTWLAVCLEHGISDVIGIDGYHIHLDQLEIPKQSFMRRDLTRPLPLNRSFDLAICMEVAEHLPSTSADQLVELLVSLAPAILFSAAIPLQGGTSHVNEQWPTYWTGLFRDHDYIGLDLIRPKVWHDNSVEWWYAQNSLLYIQRDRITSYPKIPPAFSAGFHQLLDVVHPRNYLSNEYLAAYYIRRATARQLLTAIPGAMRRAVASRIALRRRRRPEAPSPGTSCSPLSA